MALKGAEQALREKVFGNMSKRAADIFKDDMETLGPVKLSDVEQAQKEIVEIVQKLAESGEVNLGADGGEMLE